MHSKDFYGVFLNLIYPAGLSDFLKNKHMNKYILHNKTPVKVEDTITWAEHFEVNNRVVAETVIGEVTVSTVFLGIDYNWGRGKPQLFETMVLGGEHNRYQRRYSTWDEAEKGHHETCAMILE